VVGLARSDASAKSLVAAGAEVHRGAIEDLESLRSGVAVADGVIHLAFFHKFLQGSLSTRLRVISGGSPSGIVSRFTAAPVETDKRAIETLGTSLAGPHRSLVVAFPTMALSSGRLATEKDAPDPNWAGGSRVPSEVGDLGHGFARSPSGGAPPSSGPRPSQARPRHLNDRSSSQEGYLGVCRRRAQPLARGAPA
jgi:hypothetical protein